MRGVRWAIDQATTTAKARRVTGAGAYLLGGQVAVTQRLELDLSLDGAKPARFDSGFALAGAPLPEIAVTVSRNGLTCVDQIFTIDAVPQSALAPPR